MRSCVSLRRPALITVESPTRSSWLGRREARCRLLALAPWVLALALIRDWPAVVPMLALGILLSLVEPVTIRWRSLILTVASMMVILPWSIRHTDPLLAVGPITLTESGLHFAGLFLLKTICLVSLVAVWLVSAHLPAQAVAASRLGMPWLFAHLMALTWRYVFVLRDEWRRIRLALRTRGFANRMNRHGRHTMGQAMGSLLVRGHDRADRVGRAMRCRGFDGRFRTLGAAPAGVADYALVAGSVLLAGGLIGWDALR